MILFDPIVDNLFIGNCPSSAVDISRMQQIGISAVLCLQTDDDFKRLKIKWPKMEQHYENAGIKIVRVQIIDFDREDLVDLLPMAAQALANLMADDHRVYLHCTAGIERAPATAITWLTWHKGWKLDEAIDHVKSARRCKPFEDAIRKADLLVNQ